MSNRLIGISSPWLIKILFLIILPTGFISCSNHNRFRLNSFDNPVEVKIHRFDLDFIRTDTTDIRKSLSELQQKYPDFYPFFFYEILGLDPADTAGNDLQIKHFLSDTTFTGVNRKAETEFSDISDIRGQLSTAFSYINHYFPEIKLPEVYFIVSGFFLNVTANDQFVALGADMYLGSDYPLYPDVAYDYMIPGMRREMITSDILSELLHNRFTTTGATSANLLDAMIYEGKILYLMETFLPDISQENLTGYSSEALKWCKSNERNIWTSIIENKHLFSTDHLLISKYIEEAPFTAPVSQASPGRLGVWTGWQIVRSYIKNNPDLTLQELMNNSTAQSILEGSQYHP